MSEPSVRLKACFDDQFTSQAVSTALQLIPAIAYLTLMVFTFRKYDVVRVNKWLLVSWTFEALLVMTLVLLPYFGVEIPAKVWSAKKVITSTNLLVWTMIIF